MAEEIEVKLVPSSDMLEGFAGKLQQDAGGGAPGGAPGGGGFVGGLTSVFKGLGIASGIGLIVSILTSFKPLMTTISGLLKVVTMLLSPIMDVITLLLQPILVILKPIMLVVRQIMAPFRRAAADILRQGAAARQEGDNGTFMASIAASTAVLMGGLNAVIVGLLGETIKLAINTLGELLKLVTQVIIGAIAQVAGIFSEGARNNILDFADNVGTWIDEGVTYINKGVDAMTASTIGAIGESVASMAEAMGFDMKNFRDEVNTVVNTVILKDANSILAQTQSAFDNLVGEDGVDISTPFGILKSSIQQQLDDIGRLKSKASNIVDRMREDRRDRGNYGSIGAIAGSLFGPLGSAAGYAIGSRIQRG